MEPTLTPTGHLNVDPLDLVGSQKDVSPALAYWRRFGERYVTELCHLAELAPIPPPDLSETVASAPPMTGGEYLRTETLERLWAEMDRKARSEIADVGLEEWLRSKGPLWHRVGRVTFHLAENPTDEDFPFAFLATYSTHLTGRRVEYQPLGRALEEMAGTQKLAKLLTPVTRAAERLPWVRTLLESSEIFHPLRWTPDEAYRLLSDIPALEESGLLVRVPDWWTRRPPRVRVEVVVGDRAPKLDVFDFRARLALDGEELTDEERERLLAGHDGLVFLKGRWVEVDREKLQGMLAHWEEVAREGVPFLEGMRLLAGAPLEADREALFSGDWSMVRAGDWLSRRPPAPRIPSTLRATLRPYQETGVAWLHFTTRLGLGACLADDMGLGKTIQVLALLLLMKEEGRRPSLVVVPASLLENWKSEIERFAPSLVARYEHPSQPPGPADADVVLTTYGMLPRLPPSLWTLVVVDEAQAIKNPAAKQTRLVRGLQAESRIALTGTPIENRLSDLWSIFDFLSPGLLGSLQVFRDFVKRLEKRERDPYAPLRRLVGSYILRRLKTDRTIIADLPDKTEVRAWCSLTKKQAALYEKSVADLREALAAVSGMRRRGVVLAFLQRFKQICNHPSHWLGAGRYPEGESGKFHRLRELCEEIASRQEKALVFTQFREIAEPLSEFLEGVFGRPGVVLHGQVPVARRRKLVDAFQREDGPPFFVLSLRAGGTGLNLTAAAHVLHFDRWWNPAVENQATDRAFRIGQNRNVLVHKFVCRGTIEERIDAMIGEKSALALEVLEGGTPKLLTEMSDRELLDLVRLDAAKIGEE